MTATYSPEDNKLRLYSVSRLSPELYARVKEAGFKFAPRQELLVAPMWTPGREDLLLELCGEIDDEDTSLVERAEERSERFSEYSEHRAEDADRAQKAVAAIADGIPFGQPILVGHHSERRAVKMWDTATYWTDRTAGAIRNAKHKERPDVRARRIKGSEADKRKQERTIAESTKFRKAWTREGLTDVQAQQIARSSLVQLPHCHLSRLHLRRLAEPLERAGFQGDRRRQGRAARRISSRPHHRPCLPLACSYENRIAYEKAMLAEDGGTLADQNKPEKGGACRCWASPRGGWSYIQEVNKVSVSVLHNYSDGGRAFSLTVPFDKLTGIMSAAEVEQKRSAGLVIESEKGIGFYLSPAPTQPEEPTDEEQTETAKIEEPASEPDASPAEAEAEPVAAPPCAACNRPWSAHATHPATTCGYYWSADEWAKEQARVTLPAWATRSRRCGNR